MNNDQVKQLIQGIGLLTELWTITYQGFRQQGLSDAESIKHTRELISVMVATMINTGGTEDKE